MRRSIVKKGRVKSTFIYLCLLFKEYHVRLAEKIFDIINNYKKEYGDIDLEFIKNTLEIVNENLNERVNI